MNEEEAAAKLAALLNEIEEAGHAVFWAGRDGAMGLLIGDVHIAQPPCEDEPWEVQEL